MKKQYNKIELQRKIENTHIYKPSRVRWERLYEMREVINEYTDIHGYFVSVYYKQGMKNELTVVKNGETIIDEKPMNNNEIYQILDPIYSVSLDLRIEEIDERIEATNKELEELENSTIETNVTINENITPEELINKEVEKGDLIINNVSIIGISYKVKILSEDEQYEGMKVGDIDINFSDITIIGKYKDIKAFRQNLNLVVIEYILSEYIEEEDIREYTEDDVNRIKDELEYFRIGELQ